MYTQAKTRQVPPIALRFVKHVHGPCGKVWPFASPTCPGCSRKA